MPLPMKKPQKRGPPKPRYRKPVWARYAVHERGARIRFMGRGTVADAKRVLGNIIKAREAKRKQWEALVEEFPKRKELEKSLLLAEVKRLEEMEALAKEAVRSRNKYERRVTGEKYKGEGLD